MDQQKTGAFLQKLRKEKNLTQEQLAEQFGTSRRSVSRWETGSNLPDIDILMELADFYELELRELLNGERKNEQMNNEVKDAVLKAAEYNNAQKIISTKVLTIFLSVGILGILTDQFLSFLDLPHTFWSGLAKGLSAGSGVAALIFGLMYAVTMMRDLKAEKKRLQQK